MDLIPGVDIFFGTIGTLNLLDWDTFHKSKPITKAEMHLSLGATSAKPQQKTRGLFYKG